MQLGGNPWQEPWWNAAVKVFGENDEPQDLKDVTYFEGLLVPRVKTFLKMVMNS